jgi:hypothetical protein
LKCELRLKERKAAQHKADLTLGKRFLRSAMREVNELDLDFELGVAEPNNDPAVAIPELVRHVRSLNSVQNSCANVCDVARHRASALACHIRLDGVFSLDTAETKAALGITQAAADSAKQDAEDAAAHAAAAAVAAARRWRTLVVVPRFFGISPGQLESWC